MSSLTRHGIGTVRPYLYGHLDSIGFIVDVFGAEIFERHDFPHGGSHVEARIGDSAIVMEACVTPPEGATRASVYVYVEDVDATYERAIRSGAKTLSPPEDKPYAERSAGVTDSFGNVWWIATLLPANSG